LWIPLITMNKFTEILKEHIIQCKMYVTIFTKQLLLHSITRPMRTPDYHLVKYSETNFCLSLLAQLMFCDLRLLSVGNETVRFNRWK